MKPMEWARKSASSLADFSETSSSLMKIFPRVGLSMQPIRLSRVVLPLPDGPEMARRHRHQMEHVVIMQSLDRLFAKLVVFIDVFYADNAHRGFGPSMVTSEWRGESHDDL